jgi:hypothetical protein
MLRIETERAVVPMPAAADRWADEGLAMTALELFGFGFPAGRCAVRRSIRVPVPVMRRPFPRGDEVIVVIV